MDSHYITQTDASGKGGLTVFRFPLGISLHGALRPIQAPLGLPARNIASRPWSSTEHFHCSPPKALRFSCPECTHQLCVCAHACVRANARVFQGTRTKREEKSKRIRSPARELVLVPAADGTRLHFVIAAVPSPNHHLARRRLQ